MPPMAHLLWAVALVAHAAHPVEHELVKPHLLRVTSFEEALRVASVEAVIGAAAGVWHERGVTLVRNVGFGVDAACISLVRAPSKIFAHDCHASVHF